MVNKKVSAAVSGGLLPILCIGELLEQRKASETNEVVSRQLKKGLAGLGTEKVSAVTIAYEPVWAIGTGLTAASVTLKLTAFQKIDAGEDHPGGTYQLTLTYTSEVIP